MESVSHECPVDGCTIMVPFHILMCRAHWRMCPAMLQRQVLRAWNNGAPEPRYLAVREEAIVFVTRVVSAVQAR